MLARENFDGPPVCVRTRLQGRGQARTGRHVWHNRKTLPQDNRARQAGRARARGPKFEVFGTSNPELRTSDRASLACLALRASRSMDDGGRFQGLTLRDNTERPETVTIGTNELIGTDPSKLPPALTRLMAGQWKTGAISPKWDGKAAERIVEHLERVLAGT